MVMTDISKSNLESVPYANIFSIIDNRTNISDPRGHTDRTFVYDIDPLMKGIGFSGLPYIILELPTLEFTHESTNRYYAFANWKQNITIRTARDGAANTRTDVGRTDIFAIGDDLQETLNSPTILSSLRTVGIQHIKIIKASTDLIVVDNKMMYESKYVLSYKFRVQVAG
jgi:hypothetical protein